MELAELTAMPHVFDEDFFHLVMDHNPNWVFVKNERSEYLYANEAFLKHMPPHKRNSVIGSTLVEEFSSPTQVEIYLEEDRKAFRQGETEIIEEITDYTGKTTTILTRKKCFTAKNGQRLLLCISTDITDMAKTQRELVQANNTLQNFAALAAHDLRSPLCTYMSLLELIKLDKETYLSDRSAHYLALMSESATHLMNHINALLSTYKASHANKIQTSDVDLNMVLEQVKFNLDSLIGSTDAKIMSNRLPVLTVDENLFRHMLHNLIENSLKYRSDQTPVIIIKHEKKNDVHLFTIEDNGIGIAPAQEQKVFQLYEQGNEEKSAGVGLGLSLCRRIAQLHNGKMWIDHEYNKGCRICFTIQT